MCQLGSPLRALNVSEEEPLIGFRQWRLYGQEPGNHLIPLSGHGVKTWHYEHGPIFQALHNERKPYEYDYWNSPSTPAHPHFNNECGFWAYKDELSLPFQECVFGAIYQWGEVVEHSQGYRSSHAAIVFLLNVYKSRNLEPEELASLACNYNVPVATQRMIQVEDYFIVPGCK